VYEQTQEVREVGAGIQVSPNATRILHRLGLAEPLATTGVQPLTLRQRRWNDGRTLSYAPLGEAVESACGAPLLSDSPRRSFECPVKPLPRRAPTSWASAHILIDHGNRVEGHFENGKSTSVDALVGADGIHSAVRRILFGGESPQFTGCVAYRGVVAAERLASLKLPVEFQIWMGPHKHFVHYFVRNGRLVNFVALVDQDSWTRESWTEQAEVADVLAAFDGWHPQVLSILGAVDEAFIWGFFERPPMEHWSAGRVTLLGDACRAMLPFWAQGAARAIEDGAVLAACLAKIGGRDIAQALRLYESLRLPRASRVQAASKENKTRFHLPDGAQQRQRDAQLGDASTDWFLKAIA
jgi:2-polyprenyl-6-methoxyphenol hydroxylase-like FAD-dependent oxidoreductase